MSEWRGRRHLLRGHHLSPYPIPYDRRKRARQASQATGRDAQPNEYGRESGQPRASHAAGVGSQTRGHAGAAGKETTGNDKRRYQIAEYPGGTEGHDRKEEAAEDGGEHEDPCGDLGSFVHAVLSAIRLDGGDVKYAYRDRDKHADGDDKRRNDEWRGVGDRRP